MPEGADDKRQEEGKPVLPDKGADPEGYWREYFKREAQEAFKARDEAKAEARKLAERALPEAELKRLRDAEAAVAAVEEDRKRKAGEFDTLKSELVAKHEKELQAAQQRAAELETTIAQREITTAFAQASDWFGPTGKTILPPEIAQDSLGKYCEVKDGRVIVKRATGEVIHGRDGNPAPFAEALGELIASLPKHLQDSLLRGSGKTGSGASGGSLSMDSDDLATLTEKVKRGVSGATEALQRKLTSSGRIVAGRAFQSR